ncbi:MULTISPECIES: hypothetical protein [unclassified Nocardioides]|uniref:hypothetical protein n=1 Tax=unclassified Nocardioides TaxID=2615069 RepID=UPI003014DF59
MRRRAVGDLAGVLLVLGAYLAVHHLLAIHSELHSYQGICFNTFGQQVPCSDAVAPLAKVAAVLLVVGLVVAQRRSARR